MNDRREPNAQNINDSIGCLWKAKGSSFLDAPGVSDAIDVLAKYWDESPGWAMLTAQADASDRCNAPTLAEVQAAARVVVTAVDGAVLRGAGAATIVATDYAASIETLNAFARVGWTTPGPDLKEPPPAAPDENVAARRELQKFILQRTGLPAPLDELIRVGLTDLYMAGPAHAAIKAWLLTDDIPF
jgi:hypothetical protein